MNMDSRRGIMNCEICGKRIGRVVYTVDGMDIFCGQDCLDKGLIDAMQTIVGSTCYDIKFTPRYIPQMEELGIDATIDTWHRIKAKISTNRFEFTEHEKTQLLNILNQDVSSWLIGNCKQRIRILLNLI
jgi:hypothetical protein